jgi:hypothetical protein
MLATFLSEQEPFGLVVLEQGLIGVEESLPGNDETVVGCVRTRGAYWHHL